MEAVNMCRRLPVVVFVAFCVYLIPVCSSRENNNVVNFVSYASSAEDAIVSASNTKYLERNKRDVSANAEKCTKKEQTFLSELKSGKRIETKYEFANKTHFNLAMAWASENDKGTLIVVTTEVLLMMFATSNIWRSTDYGRTWTNIDEKIGNSIIRKDDGLQRNPHDAAMVYVVSYHEYMYVTEDGGVSFTKHQVVDTQTTILGDLIFHPDKRSNMVMAISSDRKLFATNSNFKDKREIAEQVVLAKWGTAELKEPDAIYALIGKSSDRNPFKARVRTYTLVKFDSISKQSRTTLRINVIAFGIQGAFLYASVYKDDPPTQETDKLMVVSTDGGKTWNEAQLPTLAGDRFFSVLDMSEELIFMHVDNPGDTGTGTLYTSSKAGVIYSESLQRHLYPNYGSVTDFYNVASMRGVYLASQLNQDRSIHTMITFDRGGVWQPIIPPQEHCKDTSKPCQLQIHNYYSISRGVKARPPLSTESAPGLVLVHGHAADALQTTPPDVYITTDGGYNWKKTLEGPHYYQITDSGGLLVAVSTNETKPQHIKFSTDEGACWHDYKFTDEPIYFTGLLTEPGGKSMTVSIWGYTADDSRKWVVHVINFADVIIKTCDDSDYTRWTPHSQMRRLENKNVEGCLLGMRESFLRLKPESWCRNGYEHDIEKLIDTCTCTREDYECDYSYYRPAGTDNCIKEPGFSGKDIDICLRGHEEEIITAGYRKIPGDKCKDGVQFTGTRIDLSEKCVPGDKSFVIELETPAQVSHHNALIGVIVTIALIAVVAVLGYFAYKMYLLRKHKVVYRYSMLNQTEADTYDNDLENALTATGLYNDSDDETLPNGKQMNGSAVRSHASTLPPKVKSFHDESDDDMLD